MNSSSISTEQEKEKEPTINIPKNSKIREYFASRPEKFKSIIDLTKEKAQIAKKNQSHRQKLRETEQKKWLGKHGQLQNCFSDKEILQLKKYFNSLDDDGSGEIDVQELENPLISLGIAETREDVVKIVESVTEEGESEIGFTDFLSIINNKDGSENSVLIDFFKDMIKGNLAGGSIPKNLSFGSIIDTVRRKKLMDALMSTDLIKKGEGMKVLLAFKRKEDFFRKFKH